MYYMSLKIASSGNQNLLMAMSNMLGCTLLAISPAENREANLGQTELDRVYAACDPGHWHAQCRGCIEDSGSI